MSLKTVTAVICLHVCISSLFAGVGTWERIDDGLCWADFPVSDTTLPHGISITVVRINPRKYALRLLCASELKEENKTVRQWVEKYNLIGAINAGMYLSDYSSNVGYMKNYDHINSSRINGYQSVAAFNPAEGNGFPFRIFDTDVTSFKTVAASYHTVIQNLRLIKRPRINRWKQQEKRWSEAALGEDRDGNILLVFSRFPFSMHDFNELLLRLPLAIVTAQHLEGGHEASLYLNHNNVQIQRVGWYAADLIGNDVTASYSVLPNVLGIQKRTNTQTGR